MFFASSDLLFSDMNINDKHWRTIWVEDCGYSIGVIDQTKLPHKLSTLKLNSCEKVADAISSMVVRGAPLIGVAGAYGMMLALQKDASDEALEVAFSLLDSTRPTAVNLRWALQRVFDCVNALEPKERAAAARNEADLIAEEDVAMCEAIGEQGVTLLRDLCIKRPPERRRKPLNVLTHCNAGWLATVDWGTALSPVYKAHRQGVDLHVWVDETRPRNQGASLTAYELAKEGVPHTVIVDNAGGHLMQKGLVDVVIVGADRVTSDGTVCNKIGTYLKALAAFDNFVPFYVAIPTSTIDWTISDGMEISIENRAENEVKQIEGLLLNCTATNEIAMVQLTPNLSKAFNPAFDITPSRLVTALITESGLIPANKEGLLSIQKNP